MNNLVKKLNDSLNRWEHLRVHGGQDPFWSDGCSMGLVRNHILHEKRNIKELCENKNLELPEVYYKETPPEINNDYMARADEIRKNADRALEKYKADKNYQYLLMVTHRLSKEQKSTTSIDNVINYCKGLETFIEKDDLVAMRRHERYERYLDSFKTCKAKIEDLLQGEPKEGQISMLEMMSGGEER